MHISHPLHDHGHDAIQHAIQGVDTSTAYFRPFSQTAIAALLAEGAVLGCAGGIMIEHELVQPFVKEIAGTLDGIQGLPKHLAEQLIDEATEAEAEAGA